MNDKNLNEEILNADLLTRNFWDNSVYGMRITDEKGIILLVNAAYCKTFKLNIESLIGNHFSVVYHVSDHESVQRTFQQNILNNKTTTQFESEKTLWNGEKLWFEFSNSLLTLPDDSKILMSIIRDVTVRKRSELELRESEYKYKLIFNNANDAVFVTQLSKDKTYGDFIEVNDIACRHLGYSREEFLKLSPSAIISPDSINEFNANMERLIEEQHIIFETVHKAKDKKLIPVEVNSHLFQFNNRSTVLSVARNIAERKKSQAVLEKSKRNLRNLATRLQIIREQERTMIAREIHDELGQALTVLKIHVTLLSNKLRNDQQEMKEKATLTLKMIDDIVESVQKISSKLRPDILDELGLIAAIEWQSKEFERLTNIRCSLLLPEEELIIEPDKATAIFRIFQEALTNVARHSEADTVSITLRKEHNSLALQIKDNGIGITQGQISDVKSLGILGMKERAMVFGGEVIIESIFGKGTLLSVKLPGEPIL
ncbi:MAG: PAS domain-containing sensor histidine kinase [Ignavibacteriaceae bacterium]